MALPSYIYPILTLTNKCLPAFDVDNENTYTHNINIYIYTYIQ